MKKRNTNAAKTKPTTKKDAQLGLMVALAGELTSISGMSEESLSNALIGYCPKRDRKQALALLQFGLLVAKAALGE